MLFDDTASDEGGRMSPQSEWDFEIGGCLGPRPRWFQFELTLFESSRDRECTKSDSLPATFLLYFQFFANKHEFKIVLNFYSNFLY